MTSPICIIYYSEANCWRIHMYISLHCSMIPTSWNWWFIKHFMLRLEDREQYTCSLCPFMIDLSHMHNDTLFWGQLLKESICMYMYISLHWGMITTSWNWWFIQHCMFKIRRQGNCIHIHLVPLQVTSPKWIIYYSESIYMSITVLGSSGGVVNSLDFCPASLKSLTSSAYFLHNGRRWE